MTARRLLPLALACVLTALTALAVPAQSGSQDAPEVADAPDDASLAPLDIAAVWFEANASHLVVHIERAEGADSPAPAVACQEGQCVGAGVALRVVFQVRKPDGSAPAIEGYNASYVLLRRGPDDPALATAYGYQDADGAFNPLGQANATVDGAGFDVSVPLDVEVLGIPLGPAPGAYRLTAPYAISYVLTCTPSGGQGTDAEGCLMRPPPVEQMGSAWDRAPDTGSGTDFVFASPPDAAADKGLANGSAPASTTTVTVVQTEERTTTVTETATFTHTPFPLQAEAKGAPAAGVALAAAALAVGLLARRRLA